MGKLTGTPETNTIGIIFQEVRRNKMKSASNLKDVIDIINKINFNNEDDSHILSLFYEDLLVKLGKESGIAGEFYTPRPIVKLIVKMIDPKLNEKDKKSTKMLDPFCGSCGFLVESFKHFMKNKPNSKDVPIIQHVFSGNEKKSLPYLVGFMNCVLHELITPNVIRKNALNDNILHFGPEDKYDYVLTNPPFGGTENKQIQQNFPVKVQATELLAIQLVMRRLKSNGKCGIVVPEGLLSRSDSFAKVKKELLENYNLHTIISLPLGTFANVTSTGQGPKTDILFFDKTGPTSEIWYYELLLTDDRNFSKANPIKDDDLEDCFLKWQKKEISNNSWKVSVTEIDDKYDISAKNPNIKKQIRFKNPKQLINSIMKDEEEIQRVLNKIKTELN